MAVPVLMVPPPLVSSVSQMRFPTASVARSLVPLHPAVLISCSPPALTTMPLAKVELAALPVRFRYVAVIPPENVEVEVLVTTKLVIDEVPAFKLPPVMVNPLDDESPAVEMPPTNVDDPVEEKLAAPLE